MFTFPMDTSHMIMNFVFSTFSDSTFPSLAVYHFIDKSLKISEVVCSKYGVMIVTRKPYMVSFEHKHYG